MAPNSLPPNNPQTPENKNSDLLETNQRKRNRNPPLPKKVSRTGNGKVELSNSVGVVNGGVNKVVSGVGGVNKVVSGVGGVNGGISGVGGVNGGIYGVGRVNTSCFGGGNGVFSGVGAANVGISGAGAVNGGLSGAGAVRWGGSGVGGFVNGRFYFVGAVNGGASGVGGLNGGVSCVGGANGAVSGVGVNGGASGVAVTGKDGPRFRDFGGMREILEELEKKIIVPMRYPHLLQSLGVKPMSGLLLHGPPGCGKTRLAQAIANEAGVPFLKVSATELASVASGESERRIRELFEKAYITAPSIVFIDEIDVIASKREKLWLEKDIRIVTELMNCMDQSNRTVNPGDNKSYSGNFGSRIGHVLVIGATNRPDSIDPALRRPGRFDQEIYLGVPNEKARVEILSSLRKNLNVEGSFDLHKIAKDTPGFVGADLVALANEAGNLALGRIIDQKKRDFVADNVTEQWWMKPWPPEEMKTLTITMADFEKAAKLVQPSSKREGFSTFPNIKWEDVGGLGFIRQEFERGMLRALKYPEEYAEFGLDMEAGFLLYGPPGCGKTLIAKALASEAGINFIHIKGPELLNKWLGESERAIRTLFSRARTCSPCILFFDEVDALGAKRENNAFTPHVARVLNQLLIELDGADQRQGVFVIGATNRPEAIDAALLRPGRLGKLLYVPLPSSEERELILKALGRKKPIDASVDFSVIARMESCENLSGADLSALMNEAATIALEEKLLLKGMEPCENLSGADLAALMNEAAKRTSTDETKSRIKTHHFAKALTKIKPSVSDEQRRYYQALSQRFNAA